MKKAKLFTIAVVVIVLAALAYFLTVSFQEESQLPNTPVIYLGQDKCYRCGMIISDMRYTAAMLVEGEYDFRKYDDVGCMLVEYNKVRQEKQVLAVMVHDYLSDKWVKADNAWFLVTKEKKIRTPMGYGVIAFKNYDEAQKYAKQYGGEVISWEDLLSELPNIIGGESS